MKNLVKKVYYTVFPAKEGKKNGNSQPIFIEDKQLGISRRQYASYQEYLAHQSEKLGKKLDQIQQYDLEYEQIVKKRYQDAFDFSGKTMLCLAARLGGEVRAFKSLGAVAIGIDLEPGKNNQHVLYGDFHNLQFPDNSFDFAFTNAIDHVFELELFLKEVQRVLVSGGLFIIEFGEVNPSEYEVLDTKNINPILNVIKNYFKVIDNQPLTNSTGFTTWSGKLLRLQKV